ncbi:uncharacterized protein LOC18049425 isoform X3 [Citrus clementina]|uniref:uncharacterized protein LOC18049425 isoform X3 n=1 Tax=Citrus clementina TaxID=85681 RepID=UPI000CED703E|nr:uncharacterized protein LOC18049425 isoform X3 [Citrus x clementina]
MDTKVLSSGIRYTNLPESYVRPESERPNLSEVSECENVPVIDLACDDRSLIVQQVAYACKNYGFFQVINHKLPLEAVERVLEVVKEFFNRPVEEKLKLHSDDPSKTMRLSTSFNVNKEKVHNWRDYLRLHCYPLDKYVPEWPSNPSTFKTINDMMYSYLPDHTLDISESEFMCNFVHKVVQRWGSLPIRGFNQETITSKLKTDSPQVLYGLASKLIKKPKKLELLLDKYGLGVRSTAFRSQTSSGEQSSPGGGGEDHIIEGCYLGHESFATVGSSDLASPALNNTPSASDQSVGASALLQNRDGDEQPPPDRSLSDLERGVAPPAERQLNPSSVAQICLPLSCGVCIAPLQIWYAGTSLTPNAKILLLFVGIFGVAGLLLSFGAYWFQRKRKTSGVMTVMGCVFTICGFLSILGTRFPEKAMIWLTAALWTLPIVASPFALKELV